MVDLENSSAMAVCSTGGNQTPTSHDIQPIKKRRNLPGMPDPDAEVIALSPAALLATNRFVCEICSKGFQRDQNLQLHRRGHNLPWKLKQRDCKETRKRVYICPVKTCIHHDPSRALGDLTGIKKHFSRKHGEKKWNCERCAKKYAVQSDCKTHMKKCGRKEYKCDCGAIFSRRDSFISHRAFCDAFARENEGSQTQNPDLEILQQLKGTVMEMEAGETCLSCTTPTASGGSTTSCNNSATDSTDVFASNLPSSSVLPLSSSSSASYLDMIFGGVGADHNINVEPMSLSLSSSLYHSSTASHSLFVDQTIHKHHSQYIQAQQPDHSATALLQKAAQMGATSLDASFLHALGLTPQQSTSTIDYYQEASIGQWKKMKK